MNKLVVIFLLSSVFIIQSAKAQTVQISAGCGHVIVRMTDGSLWGWGDNSAGQLGLGHYNSQSKPIRIGNDADWKWVSSGCVHTMAIKNNGSIWGWGGNYNGQLGTGNNLDRAIPTRLDKGFVWDEVYAGLEHTIAKKKDGTLWGWPIGNVVAGAMHGSSGQVGASSEWLSVSTSTWSSSAIKSDGSLWVWGNNNQHPIGNGRFTPFVMDRVWQPELVPGGKKWKKVSNSPLANFAIADDGSLWGWGRGLHKTNLKTDFTYNDQFVLAPIRIGNSNDWVEVSSGLYSVYMIKNDGSMWGWGSNDRGQLANANIPHLNEPYQIGNDFDWIKVHVTSGGFGNTVVGLKRDGTLWTWGGNSAGALGIGRQSSNQGPKQLESESKWKKLSSNLKFGLKEDGTLWGWGTASAYISLTTWDSTSIGYLGDGLGLNRPRPSKVLIDSPIKDFYGGNLGGYAILNDGRLFGWGTGYLGSGVEQRETRLVPVQIGSDSDWDVISGSYFDHARAFAIKTNGQLYAWGRIDFSGIQRQHLDPSILSTPRLVNSDTDWVDISTFGGFTLALKEDSSVWTWGIGYHGDGDSIKSVSTPKRLPTDVKWKHLPKYNFQQNITLIDVQNSIWMWGGSSSGPWYGDGTQNYSWSPIKVVDNRSHSGMSSGISCEIDVNGRLWVWGRYSDRNQNEPIDIMSRRMVDDGRKWVEVYPWEGMEGSPNEWGCVGIVQDGTMWAWGDYPNIDGSEWDNIPSRVTIGDIGTSIHESKPTLATNTSLNDNYPNPFNPETLISFDIPQATRVRVTVYNLLGMPIRTLVNGVLNSGTHSVKFDGSNLSSGVYFYRLEVNDRSFTKKMTLLK